MKVMFLSTNTPFIHYKNREVKQNCITPLQGSNSSWNQTKSSYFLSLQELSDIGVLEQRRVIYHPLQIPVQSDNRDTLDFHE